MLQAISRVVALLSVGASLIVAQTTQVFTSGGKFDDAHWETVARTANQANIASVTYPVSDRHPPDTIYRLDMAIQPSSSATVIAFDRQAIHEPSQGAIRSIDFSEDLINLGSNALTTEGFGLAIRTLSDGKVYAVGDPAAPRNSWSTQQHAGITAGDLIEIDSNGVPIQSSHPNLNVGSIQFGFEVGRGNSPPSSSQGFDNWSVTLHLTPTSVCDSTFSDGAFNDSDWQTMQVRAGNGGSYTATRRTAGGNPGAFRQVDITVNAGSTANRSQLWGVQFKLGATYNPSTLGAIATIDYSEDAIYLGGATGDGQGTGPALRQNGKIYAATTVTHLPSAWTNVSLLNLQASDFGELGGAGQFYNAGSHPDFSSNGSQMEFGFWRGNTSLSDAYSTSAGIDNWTVIVHSSCHSTAGNLPNAGTTADPVSTATGEYFEDSSDLNLGGPLPLRFTRYYASFLAASGVTSALGGNWMHNFDVGLLVTSSDAVVTLYRGKTVHFTKSGSAWQLAGNEKLNHQFASTANGYSFLDLGQNLIYTFSNTGTLISIADRNGNTLTVTRSAGSQGPDQVSDGLGRSLSFLYSNGQLMRVQDQTGRSLSFAYNGSDLSSFTDANGKTTRYSYVTSGQLATKALPTGATPVNNAFDEQGRVVKQTDALGNAITIAYNSPSAGTTSVTDALANTFQHIHQGQANLSGYIDPAGQGVVLNYDAANRLSGFTDRLGDKTVQTYHSPSGFLASYADASGAVTTYAYTPQTQLGFTFYNATGVSYADGTSVRLSYDASGNVLSAVDQRGKTSSYSYNSRGQLTSSTNPLNGITTYVYNVDGTLASVKLPSGDLTSFAYDDKKRLAVIQYADGATRSFAYDAADRIVQSVNELGNKTSAGYDDNGQLKSVTNRLGATTTLAYDNNQRPASVTDAAGEMTQTQLDPLGRIQTLTPPTGETAQLAFDPLNRLASIKDAYGNGISFGYDSEGVLASVADGAGQAWSLTSSPTGRITAIKSPLGWNFTLAYDALGRLISSTNPLSQTTTYTRDTGGLLAGILLPGGISSAFTRNDLGQLTTITDPNGNRGQQTYDSEGKLVSEVDPLGRTRSYFYGPRNGISEIDTGEGSVKLTYDAAGNLTRRLYSDGTDLDFSYDAAGRAVTANGVTLSFDTRNAIIASNGLTITRDESDRIAAITYTDGKTVSYNYDGRGLLAQVTDWSGGVSQLTYDNVRRLASIARPNGITAQYTYDLDGRLVSLTENQNGNALSAIALQRDGAGNIISAQRNVPLSPNPAPGVAPFAYDAANQVVGGSYDSMGRPVTLGLLNLTWDLASRLTSFSSPNGSASFTYDAYGMRVSSSALTYVWNYGFPSPKLSVTRDASGDRRYYVYLPDGTLLYSVEAADNTHHYFHFDEIGNTIFLSDDNGAIIDSYSITPYGEQVDHSGPTDNPFTFMGQWGVMQEGNTGLYYMGFRYYDSATARFLTREPRPALDPRALAGYQYAFDNPLAFVDPLGQGHIGRQTNRAESDFGKFVLELPDALTSIRSPNELLVPKLGAAILNFLHGQDRRKETDR